MKDSKVLIYIGFIVLILILIWSPKGNSTGTFSDILNHIGNKQEYYSQEITNNIVSEAESKHIGEHKEDGSNWSIPNIIRSTLGVN